MNRTNAQDRLFSEDELTGIQPTGSPWIVSDDDPATVPVPLQTTIVDVKGPYTERDRKLWVFLLHAVFEELGVGALLFANLSKKGKSVGNLTFGFPPNLIPIIKEPMRFARLRVHFLMKLSGKYAVTLYEILEGYANRRDGRCEVSIDDLRVWLKVPEGSYKTWKDLRRWVIDPAIKQINDDPVGAGFSVKYTGVREGRSFARIVFTITKTDNRAATERLLKAKGAAKRKAAKGDLVIEPWAEDKARKIAQEKGWDYQALWNEWRGFADNPKNPSAAFVGFCRKKESLR